MIVTIIAWAGGLALLFGLAAAMELGAIRRRINGANGLVFLMAGLLGLASAPLGFAALWWWLGLQSAALATGVVAVLGGGLWWALLNGLDRAARRQGPG